MRNVCKSKRLECCSSEARWRLCSNIHKVLLKYLLGSSQTNGGMERVFQLTGSFGAKEKSSPLFTFHPFRFANFSSPSTTHPHSIVIERQKRGSPDRVPGFSHSFRGPSPSLCLPVAAMAPSLQPIVICRPCLHFDSS